MKLEKKIGSEEFIFQEDINLFYKKRNKKKKLEADIKDDHLIEKIFLRKSERIARSAERASIEEARIKEVSDEIERIQNTGFVIKHPLTEEESKRIIELKEQLKPKSSTEQRKNSYEDNFFLRILKEEINIYKKEKEIKLKNKNKIKNDPWMDKLLMTISERKEMANKKNNNNNNNQSHESTQGKIKEIKDKITKIKSNVKYAKTEKGKTELDELRTELQTISSKNKSPFNKPKPNNPIITN